jgi:hypothetical protein
MRKHRVNKIDHIVYDTQSEVPPKIYIHKDWRKANIGDWVLADDESVIQILRKGSMMRKN